MRSRLLLLLCLVAPVNFILAQSEFKPGFIINNTNDTIFGVVDSRGDYLMSMICRFRENGTKKTVEYTPDQISAYKFDNGNFYVARTCNNKRMFMECMVKGRLNMYYARDNEGDHYYMDKRFADLVEIPYKEEIVYQPITHLVTSKQHIGLLLLYTQDAPELQAKITSMKEPKRDNLMKIAEEYHNLTEKDEKCIVYSEKKPKVNFYLEPFAGAVYYSGGINKFLADVGLNIYIGVPSENKRLYVKTGINYHVLKEQGETLYVNKFPLQLAYIYSVHKLQPRAGFGVSILSVRYSKYSNMTHMTNFNVGLNYKISSLICLSVSCDIDCTPLTVVLFQKSYAFNIISSSYNAGLFFKL